MVTSTKNNSVLLVDDEKMLLDLYEQWLSAEYNTRKATSGTEALEKLDETVSVVLLDRRMPGIGGIETLKKIRERDTSHHIAMVSAVKPSSEDLDLDLDEYVVKPTNKDELHTVVHRLVNLEAKNNPFLRYSSMVSKQSAFEQHVSDSELNASPEYGAFLSEIRTVRQNADIRDTKLGSILPSLHEEPK